MKGLERNDAIKVLNFSHCNISDHGLLAICKMIVEKNTMESLVLVNNDIGNVYYSQYFKKRYN